MNIELVEKHFRFIYLNFCGIHLYDEIELFNIFHNYYHDGIRRYHSLLIGKKVLVNHTGNIGYITKVVYSFGRMEMRVQYDTKLTTGHDFEHYYCDSLTFI